MIDGIGKSGSSRIELRGTAGKSTGVGAAAPVAGADKPAGVGGAVASLLAGGPPVDTDKVARIKAAIASGAYPVDPDRIAEAMIALDLPQV